MDTQKEQIVILYECFFNKKDTFSCFLTSEPHLKKEVRRAVIFKFALVKRVCLGKARTALFIGKSEILIRDRPHFFYLFFNDV